MVQIEKLNDIKDTMQFCVNNGVKDYFIILVYNKNEEENYEER